MRKFLVLLKKEVKELVTLQILIPMIVGAFAFMLIGNVIGKEVERATSLEGTIAVLDLDQSAFSKDLLEKLKKAGFTINSYPGMTLEEAKEEVKATETNSLLVFPKGFAGNIFQGKVQHVDVYNFVRSLSMMAGSGSSAAYSAVSYLNEEVSNYLLLNENPQMDLHATKNPIRQEDFVIIKGNEAKAHPGQIQGFISTQTMFIPIVLFIVIMSAAQMIITSVAAEKENKTLETLLSTPIKRTSLVTAKMMAAGLVGLLVSAFYLFGYGRFLGGITGSVMTEGMGDSLSSLLAELGLVLTPASYVLLGLSVFSGILCVLAISMILGVFADSLKAAQGLMTPLIFLIMIPYLLSSFLDLSTVTPILRYAIYAIPFAHPFMVMPNLFLQNFNLVLGGIIYQSIVFIILAVIAARIYSTDRVMTMKLGRKKKNAR